MKRFYRENFYKSLILKRRKPRSRISNSCPKPQNQIGIKTYPLLIQNIGSKQMRWVSGWFAMGSSLRHGEHVASRSGRGGGNERGCI